MLPSGIIVPNSLDCGEIGPIMWGPGSFAGMSPGAIDEKRGVRYTTMELFSAPLPH